MTQGFCCKDSSLLSPASKIVPNTKNQKPLFFQINKVSFSQKGSSRNSLSREQNVQRHSSTEQHDSRDVHKFNMAGAQNVCQGRSGHNSDRQRGASSQRNWQTILRSWSSVLTILESQEDWKKKIQIWAPVNPQHEGVWKNPAKSSDTRKNKENKKERIKHYLYRLSKWLKMKCLMTNVAKKVTLDNGL